MNLPFDLNTFLHCPQGPRLEGEARTNACRVLGTAIPQGLVMTAAELLMQDPSLITERICQEPFKKKPAVQRAMDAGLDVFVLFALAHGMPVTDPAFGSRHGLLKAAVERNSPGLVSIALLYRADPNKWEPFWNKKHSLLDMAIRKASEIHLANQPCVDALNIAHMLLDAGGVPLRTGAANSSIHDLCNKSWAACGGDAEYFRIFKEVVKRTRNIEEVQPDDPSVVILACMAGNFEAAKELIKAGAPVHPNELYASLEIRRMSQHIQTFKALIEERARARSDASAFIPSSTAKQNLVPDGFLQLPPVPRLIGAAREDARCLLHLALTQGRFVTATKILLMDPSLITDSVEFGGKSAIKSTIDSGMTALVPFALAQGMRVDDPAFGYNGLLKVGMMERSPSLMSYALLNRTDPNQLAKMVPENTTVSALTFLDAVVDKCFNYELSPVTTRNAFLASMLLDSGASPCVPGAANTALPQLCAMDWSWIADQGYDELFDLLPLMLKRGGAACVDLKLGNKPALRLAAEKGNIVAVKLLVEAGANIDSDFLGVDLFKLINDNGMGDDIPALTELVMRRQIGQGAGAVLDSTVKVVAAQGEPDAPEAGPRRLTARDIF